MGHRRQRARGGKILPWVDEAFAEALAGSDRETTRRRHAEHKTRQLCRQVQRALGLTLGGECADAILAELYVLDVVPAAGSSRLLVYVQVPRDLPVSDVIARLDRVAPRLRAAVAQAVTRKRAPELAFIPVAPGEVRP